MHIDSGKCNEPFIGYTLLLDRPHTVTLPCIPYDICQWMFETFLESIEEPILYFATIKDQMLNSSKRKEFIFHIVVLSSIYFSIYRMFSDTMMGGKCEPIVAEMEAMNCQENIQMPHKCPDDQFPILMSCGLFWAVYMGEILANINVLLLFFHQFSIWINFS